MNALDLTRLAEFFPPEAISWKPIAVSKKTGKALVAAYLDNRAIMDRLDAVCGPAHWRNAYRTGPTGGLLCGLSIRIAHEDGTAEWVTKWDGAENTDVEPIKGGLSSAMRRAAVQWGIGRYLYDLPSPWVPVDERGRILKPPAIPRDYLPGQERPAPASDRAARSSSPSKGALTDRLYRPDNPTEDAHTDVHTDAHRDAQDTLQDAAEDPPSYADLVARFGDCGFTKPQRDLVRALASALVGCFAPEGPKALLPTLNELTPEERTTVFHVLGVLHRKLGNRLIDFAGYVAYVQPDLSTNDAYRQALAAYHAETAHAVGEDGGRRTADRGQVDTAPAHPNPQP